MCKSSPAQYSGCYVLHGPDEYFKEQAVKAAVELTAPAMRSLNLNRLYAPSQELLRNTVSAVPVFDDLRVVIVRDYYELPAPPSKSKEKAEQPEQENGVKARPFDPGWVPDTTLLIFHCTGSCRTTSALFKQLSKDSRVFTFPAFDKGDEARQAAGFCMKKASESGIDLQPKAAAALVRSLGYDDLFALANAIEQLGCYAGNGVSVTPEHVAAMFKPDPEGQFFLVLDMILSGRSKEALMLLRHLLTEGENGFGFAAYFEGQYKSMLSAKVMLEQNVPASRIAASLGIHEYAAKKLIGYAKRLSKERICSALEGIMAIDPAVKQGLTDDVNDALLTAILTEICK